ncbi:S-adenosyl-L-methionine-dependent methyltransferase [Xylariaceae sp. FL1272]|nr:S-adenosyl-L-methionine-dependent methyltransferase [Xylariaceae sp. FL1272]
MSSIEKEAAALADKLNALLSGQHGSLDSLSAGTRRGLSEAARKLHLATEATGDTIHRIIHAPLQLSTAEVGVETGLFETLVKQKSATTAELAKATKVDPVMMKRLLRYYQSFGMVDQTDADTFRANNITSALVTLGGTAGVPFYMETLVPVFNAIPKFLRDSGYANITDGTDCPWFLGHQTKLPPFPWFQSRPGTLDRFMSWMVSQRDGLPMFLDVIDFKKEISKFGPELEAQTPVFVDIGGSFGHQCVALKQKYPDLVGRVILQDRDEVIEQVKAKPLPGFNGIEAQAHDFFTPQPIKGARAYYMRNILHDWTDEKCVDILTSITPAMTPESRILIDEMVLPEVGAPWRATQLDLAMNASFAAAERTRAEWDVILDKANLKIVDVWKYTEELDDCIIVAVPK